MYSRNFRRIIIATMFATFSVVAAHPQANRVITSQPKPTPPPQTSAPQTTEKIPRLTRKDNSDERAAEAPNPADEEVVRVDSSLTNVFFTAVDKQKRYVTTLQRDDLRILEDGVPQEIFTFERQTDLGLSLAILIDTSMSQERTLPDEKAAARVFLESVVRPKKDLASIISFTGEATLEQGLTDNAARLQTAVNQTFVVRPSGYIGGGVVVPQTTPTVAGIGSNDPTIAGSTAIWDAIWVTSNEVLTHAPDRTRRAIILMTDGYDTSSRIERDKAIEQAIKSEVVIYSIGIGDPSEDGVDEKKLRKISEKTGGRAFFPLDETELRAAFAQIEQELRSQYLLAYTSNNKRDASAYRQVKLDIVAPALRKQNLKLTYRQGYYAKASKSAAARP